MEKFDEKTFQYHNKLSKEKYVFFQLSYRFLFINSTNHAGLNGIGIVMSGLKMYLFIIPMWSNYPTNSIKI